MAVEAEGTATETTPPCDDPIARAWRERQRHMLMLAGAVFVGVMAWLLEVLPDGQRVAFRGHSRWPLPHACAMRAWFGRTCPACGLTRSLIYLAHADWRASLRVHRLGWLFALTIAFQVPYRIVALRRGGRAPIRPRIAEAFSVVLIVLLVGNWLHDLLRAP